MAVLTGYLSADNDSQFINDFISDEISEYGTYTFDPGSSDADDSEGSSTLSRTLATSIEDTKTGYVSESFFEDFYFRIHIIDKTLNLGNIISDISTDIYVWNAYFVQKTLDSIIANNDNGVILTTPSLPAILNGAEYITLGLAVDNDGPPNLNVSYLLDWADDADNDFITAIGFRILLFPFRAGLPFKEVLNWETDVIISYNGTEQRRQILQRSKKDLNSTFPIRNAYAQLAKNLIYSWIGRRFAVPFWAEAELINGTISSGALAINCDTDFKDYRDSGLAVIWLSPTENEVISIATVGSGVINLSDAVLNNYTNPYIIPASAYYANDGTVSRSGNGYDFIFEIIFKEFLGVDIGSAPPNTYLGEDIYYDEIISKQEIISEQVTTRLNIVDNGVAQPIISTPWTYPRIQKPYSAVLEGLEEIYNFKVWLHRRRGRARPFWYPSFNNDFTLVPNQTLNSTLRCYDNAYIDFSESRNHIAVFKKDGTITPCAIDSISPFSTDQVDLFIDVDLGGILDTDVKYISYLGFNRLDTDVVTLNWHNGQIVDCFLPIIEISP